MLERLEEIECYLKIAAICGKHILKKITTEEAIDLIRKVRGGSDQSIGEDNRSEGLKIFISPGLLEKIKNDKEEK